MSASSNGHTAVVLYLIERGRAIVDVVEQVSTVHLALSLFPCSIVVGEDMMRHGYEDVWSIFTFY